MIPTGPRGVVDDGYVALVLLILGGIRKPEERAHWFAANLPRTATLIGVESNWGAITNLPGDGSGGVARSAPIPGEIVTEVVAIYSAKTCIDCRGTFAPTSGRQWRCRPCRDRRREQARSQRRVRMPIRDYGERVCVVCGQTFRAHNIGQVACTKECSKERNRQTFKSWWDRRGSEVYKERRVRPGPCESGHEFVEMRAHDLNRRREAAGWPYQYRHLSGYANRKVTACVICLHIEWIMREAAS